MIYDITDWFDHRGMGNDLIQAIKEETKTHGIKIDFSGLDIVKPLFLDSASSLRNQAIEVNLSVNLEASYEARERELLEKMGNAQKQAQNSKDDIKKLQAEINRLQKLAEISAVQEQHTKQQIFKLETQLSDALNQVQEYQKRFTFLEEQLSSATKQLLSNNSATGKSLQWILPEDLTPSQLTSCHAALLHAFPKRDTLALMVKQNLEKIYHKLQVAQRSRR